MLSPDCLDNTMNVGFWSEAIDVSVCSIFGRFFTSVRHLGWREGLRGYWSEWIQVTARRRVTDTASANLFRERFQLRRLCSA